MKLHDTHYVIKRVEQKRDTKKGRKTEKQLAQDLILGHLSNENSNETCGKLNEIRPQRTSLPPAGYPPTFHRWKIIEDR